MINFEDAWKRTGYQYGGDALENVKLGWELAVKHLVNGTGTRYRCFDCQQIHTSKPQYCTNCSGGALVQEWVDK